MSAKQENSSPEIPAFHRDPHLTRLYTAVVSVGEEAQGRYIVLADTVLYPEGGGQPADYGRVDGVEVVDVQRVEGEIRHVLGPEAVSVPTIGQPVTVELDWERRFDHMQQHTGQHLLTAVADRKFGWGTTAFHLGDRLCDIELDTPNIGADELADLEEAVATEIRAALSVTSRRVSPEEYATLPIRSRGLPAGHTGDVRLVEVSGVDLNTCGGTHCGSTAELEALKLLGTEPVRGGTRLFYAAGQRLRRIHGAHHRRNGQLRALLGMSDDELVGGVEAKLLQLKETQRTVRELDEALAIAYAERLVADPRAVIATHWPARNLPFLQRVAREVEKSASDRVLLLTAGEGEAGAFLIATGEDAAVQASAVGPRIAEILGGRGGGSGRVFQGKATTLSRLDEATALLVVGQAPPDLT